MKRLILCAVMVGLVLSSGLFGDRLGILAPQSKELKANFVKVRVTLPDSKELTAVVSEEGNLKISRGDEVYVFETRIIDAEGMNAIMENSYVSQSADRLADFHFEILAIISIPMDDLRPMAVACGNGTCCVYCSDGWSACACSVEMCGQNCCCPGCCAKER